VSARLIGRTGATAGQDYVLTGVASIGAAPDSQIRIVAPGVSRKHARIVLENDQYFLEDAGATNGTFLNGGRVTREALQHLDVITLGRAVDLIFLRRETGTTAVSSDQVTAARLQIADGPEAGAVVEVPKGELTFGRAPSCNVVLVSGLISKVHARVQRTANQVVLQDLQSINGTFVNGARVDSIQVLKNGDLINFAGVRSVSVAIEGPAAALTSTVTAPADEPAFNQEWKTRFVWAPDELAAIEAKRAEAMQLAALRSAPAAEKKAAPAPLPRRPDAARAEPVAQKPPAAPKMEGAASPTPAAPPAKPAAVAPIVQKPLPPQPVEAVSPSAQTPPEAAPPKPPAVVTAQPPAAAVPQKPPVPATPQKPPVAPVPPKPADAAIAPAAVPPKPPPAAKPGPKPPAQPPATLERPTIPPVSEGEQTIITTPPVAPRLRGLRLVGSGPPISVGLGAFVVGRAIGSDVRLDDRQVSRSHARLTVDEASASIEDFQTVNGTLVNGKEVKARQPLRHGDTVQFGASEFTVELITT
jgi:pSer/pThr/pTyr-binding forkhead associated (FHA) protein